MEMFPGGFMDKVAILALLTAKAGKEKEVEEFLKSAQALAVREPGTTTWYALKLGDNRFAIFDTFKDEAGRDAHLTGEIAKALFARAEELLSTAPMIEKLEIISSKT
jgi:quinol monooxygenase YgiN